MNKWMVPLFSLGFGGVYLLIGLISGNLFLGVVGLLIMVAYAAFLLVGSGSATVSVFHGQPADERYQGFAVNALAISGAITPIVLLGFGLVDLAQGGDGQPYARICFLAVFIFVVVALLWQRWRS